MAAIDPNQLNQVLNGQLSSFFSESTSTAYFIWASIFSIFGIAYFTFGMKRASFVFILAGAFLMFSSYFIVNVYLLAILGIIVSVFPLFWHD